MVFAINAVNGSARDFSAFQALAEQLNGTATNASTSGSASGSASPSATNTTGGALSLRVGGASALLTLVAIVASLL